MHIPKPSPRERVPVTVYRSSEEASRAVASHLADLIRRRTSEGRPAVLGLATGSTPLGVYEELVRLHRQEGLSFRKVVTFNLDEYWPMAPESPQSYHRFMREHLFDHVDVDPARTHLPDGTCPRERLAEHCRQYERLIDEAGGIDLQILGIGRTGHIGFNEPGSPPDSRTRLITLDQVTRADAAADFLGETRAPRQAITMGVGTILQAREIVLLAFGEHKAPVVRRAVEDDVNPGVAASYLQRHPAATFVLDPAAASQLTRFATPWLLGTMESAGLDWDAALTRRAVIWLSRRLDKPILKLTDEDYNEHGLQELLAARGGQRGAYDINIEVFRALQATITGWPGGRRGEHPFPRRVVVFSPHPDDDVISMGGTLIRLCEQGHEVHVAYQTSGNIAVWDETVRRHLDFVRLWAATWERGGREALAQAGDALAALRGPAADHAAALTRLKGLIRRSEALAAARSAGVPEERVHFLDLPFYETGRVRKRPPSEEDVQAIADLLRQIRPHQVYAAGDLSDPHGTHRVCLRIITRALERLGDEEWMHSCVVWLYRGAWEEWEPDRIEMAVPLSPDEVLRKRLAIFRHESQKDYAMFPGPDDRREFWQRAEDRNRRTARLYDALGLAEYEAIEGFVRWRPGMID